MTSRSSGNKKARRARVILSVVLLVTFVVGGGVGFALGAWFQPWCQPQQIVTPSLTLGVTVAAATSTPLVMRVEPSHTPTATLRPTSTPTVTPSPQPTATPSPQPTTTPPYYEELIVYGYSVQGRPLVAYRFGTGTSARAIIGGIHGGYEWNTVEFMSDTLKYLSENQHLVPPEVTLYLIPNMNPDGYVAGRDAVKGRMNANLVDLNRNWDYEWQPTATHGTRPVSAGNAPFSEPETLATRDFILDHRVKYAIFYHSAMGVVFSGADRESSTTFALTEMLSEATGYPHRTEGVPGQITTGDAIDWLSTVGIAATEIELTTHDLIGVEERERNWAGVRAFLNWPGPVVVGHSSEVGGILWTTHTVQSGESLLAIAYRCGIELDTPEYDLLLTVNQIEDEDTIMVGDVIRIPQFEN